MCFLPFLCNLSCLLYISTSVWLARKTALFKGFLVFLGCWLDMWLKPEANYFWMLVPLLSSLTFPPLPFFPSWFCVASPLQSLSGASCCIISEVHSPKTQHLPPLRWTWVFLVTEQKSWSTYFHVYGLQLTVACQGLMRTRRQHFGKVFWPAHLHNLVFGWVFFTLVWEFLKCQRGKKGFGREEKEDSQKKKTLNQRNLDAPSGMFWIWILFNLGCFPWEALYGQGN